MPITVERDRLLQLIDEGGQLVEVLPRHEYDEEHLPSAIHLPLKSLREEAVSVLDRSRPVIVYCWDAL